MTEEQKPIDLNTDYVRKVQAGILIPKRAHENFEVIKKDIKDLKELVSQVLTHFTK